MPRRQIDYKRSKTYSLSVVDIGAKTDYDATETRMLKLEHAVMAAPSRKRRRVGVKPAAFQGNVI